MRSKLGLLVLTLLCAALATSYLSTREHGALGLVNGFRPRMKPPTLTSPAEYPKPLEAEKRQQTFHGVNSCVIGSINGMNFDRTVTLNPGTIIGLGGWLIDKASQTVPDQAWIVLAGQSAKESYYVPIRLHEKRPDVSQYFGGEAGYVNSGFIVDIASTNLRAGTYHIYVVFKHKHFNYTCDNGRQLKLEQGASDPILSSGSKT